MMFFVQKWERRRLAHDRPTGGFVRQSSCNFTIFPKDVTSVFKQVDDRPRRYHWPNRVASELERRHHAEVAATAANGPEQIGLLGVGNPAIAPIRSDNIGGQQIVDSMGEGAAHPAKSTTQCQPGDSGCRVDPERNRQTESLGFVIDIPQQSAAAMKEKKGYGQYCPLAMSAEILCNRWTMLVVRELLEGSTGFNEIRRGVPLMSRTMLSNRLKELESAGLVIRATRSSGKSSNYRLTASGEALGPIVFGIAEWG